MLALIASGDLKCAARGRERSDVDVLHVRAIDAEGDGVFGFAGGAAGVTPNAAGLVDDLSPLHRFRHGEEVTMPAVICVMTPFTTRSHRALPNSKSESTVTPARL